MIPCDPHIKKQMRLGFAGHFGCGLLGQEVPIDGLGHVGAVKNTTPHTVTLNNGTKVTTIPDLWDKTVGGFLEAKNVLKLSLSPQLQAQVKIAKASDEPLNLVVSPRTQTVSRPLLDAVRSTGRGNVKGNVYVYDPVADTLTPWFK
jgi:hypothetical protein